MEPDEVLYARVKQGDMRAFDELYGRHATRLYGYLRSQLPTRADAEDVMHEAILAALESREVVFDRGSFRTWLYRIARNRVLNRARSQTRGQSALVRLGTDDERPAPADDRIAREQMLHALDDAVGRLPPALSALYHLRVSGLSYEEMAKVLDVPLGTVKSRASHMVDLLRKEMQPWTAR